MADLYFFLNKYPGKCFNCGIRVLPADRGYQYYGVPFKTDYVSRVVKKTKCLSMFWNMRHLDILTQASSVYVRANSCTENNY